MSKGTDSTKKRYLKLKAAGICTTCGKRPKKSTSILCVECRAKNTLYQRRVRENMYQDVEFLAAKYANAKASKDPVKEIGKIVVKQYAKTIQDLAEQ